jgi:lipopolysaccharide transport system ATP-binding protein
LARRFSQPVEEPVSHLAIRVERLGKEYRIGERQPYKSLRETVTRAVSARLRGVNKAPRETIWALRDVSFDVQRGEVIGIIGRNGAGKSTLLKILARITDPTEGRVEVHGRVGSLLEVGTGFHMELTGRENIYLNGAILGMKRAEIQSKFDDIVAFAEIEQFLDTPVKHYSTGMYLRLAFAVAAHLEPEILLVDEVLAVGDAAFQKKCLGKMGEVAHGGNTVLFVSHNMAAVERLCGRCLWLDRGTVLHEGTANEVVAAFLGSLSKRNYRAELQPNTSRAMCLTSITIQGSAAENEGVVDFSDPVEFALEYDINRPIFSSHVACFITNAEGVCVLGSGDADVDERRLQRRQPGHYRARFRIPRQLLGEGTYSVTVTMGKPYVEVYDRHESIVQFEVVDRTSQRRKTQHTRRPGILGIELPWDVEEIGS